MNAAPYPADVYDDDPDAERAEWRAYLLRELAETGMDFVRRLHRQVMAEPPVAEPEPAASQATSPQEASPPPADRASDFDKAALSFSRLSRAVRMTLALDERLARGDRPDGGGGACASAAPQPVFDPLDENTWTRKPDNYDAIRASAWRKIVRALVAAAIETEREAEDVPGLLSALDARLEGLAEEKAYVEGRIGDLINGVRTDLGLPRDPDAWNGAAITLGLRPGDLIAHARARRAHEMEAAAQERDGPPPDWPASPAPRPVPDPARSSPRARWSCGPPATAR